MTFYDKYMYPDGNIERKRYWEKHLSKHINLKNLKGKRVLDAGSGGGTITSILLDYGAIVFSIDASVNSINYIKNKYIKSNASVMDISNMDFPDDYFDYVFSLGVIHHTLYPERAFKECTRVSKGNLIIMLYTKYHHYPFLYKNYKLLIGDNEPNAFFIEFVRDFASWYYGGKVSMYDAYCLIKDQFYTPIAEFYSKGDIKRWCKRFNLKLISDSTTYFGQHRIYNIRKQHPHTMISYGK